ncbi:hypothetical protein NUM3379_19130 [Kineococcus sp. NUM-3379]
MPAGARDGISALLAARGRALVAGRAVDVLAGIDRHDPLFAASQEAAAAALLDVGVSAWEAEVLGVRPAGRERERELGAPAVHADVAVRERLAGEELPVRSGATLTAVLRGRRWLLAGAEGPATGLWDSGPLTTHRTGRALVLAAPAAAGLAASVAEVCDDAARRVDAAWGTGWPRRTTVLLPATAAGAARLLDLAPGALAPYAALAAGDASVAGTGVRVVVQPEVFGALSGTGRSVVLTHELVHAAGRAGPGLRGTGGAPRWLVEGGADLVAREGRDLDARELARPLLERVRAGEEPRVPADADFAPGADAAGLQVAYAAAWSLCASLARHHGVAAVVQLQRTLARAQAGTGAQEPAARVLGEDLGAAVARWRAEVRSSLVGWA